MSTLAWEKKYSTVEALGRDLGGRRMVMRWHARTTGFSSMDAVHTRTILFEISGRGCDDLRPGNETLRLGIEFYERVTRIDIAVDVLTDTRPSDFVDAADTGRFRSAGRLVSDTGETCYIGASKSDRLCRVYRYNPPHPRSRLLRTEFVFRRRLAKRAIEEYCEAQTEQDFVARAGATYGFKHPSWQPGNTDAEPLRGRTITKTNEGTVGWIYKSVVPAVRRLVKEGAIDLEELFQEFADIRLDTCPIIDKCLIRAYTSVRSTH